MKFENTLKIIEKNSLNESISIDNVEAFVGQLIKEGIVKSAVKKICYTAPLKTNAGYVFSAKKDGNTIKINKNFVEAKDHVIMTEITKEAVDDIMSQFGEDGIELITDLIKRDLYIDQDKDLFTFINSMAELKPDLTVPDNNFEAALVETQGYIDQQALILTERIKSPMGSVVIGSPKVIGLLIRESDFVSPAEDSMYSFAGSLGSRDLFVDFDATEDYITVGINGEDTLRGVVYSPYSVSTNFHTSYNSGGEVIRVNNRYAYTRNPLDNPSGVSKLFVRTKVVFDGALDNIGSDQDFIDAFNGNI